MSTFRNPVGPQPSRVYWRRRLVLLLGLLAVIVVVVLIVVRPGAGAPTPTPSGTPSAEGSGSTGGATSTNPPSDGECDLSKVTLEPVTDAASYDPGVTPTLSFTLKSTMTAPCTLSAGSDVQEFRITTGDELVWSSKDCQTAPESATIVLKPGVPFPGPSLVWDRTRSSVDTCGTAREPVVAEGASYHLTVVVGELTSANTKQFLLY